MTNTRAKIELLRTQMAKASVDVLALAPGTHMQWLLGFMPHPDERPCLLFVSQTHINFVMPQLNAQDARQHCDVDFHECSDTQGPDAQMPRCPLATDLCKQKQPQMRQHGDTRVACHMVE